jgi:Flp pilus assembly protein TadG
MRHVDDAGSATLELAILSPALLVLLAVVIAGGRIQIANGAVEQAAAAAAREASLARSGSLANAAATRQAKDSLDQQGVTCTNLRVSVDTSGFRAAPGVPATVAVDVTCTVPLSDLAIPGMPGNRQLQARTTSPLDTYRAR